MPQMGPLLWLNLFIFFSMSFMLFFVINYFLPPFSKMSPVTSPDKPETLNWKW
uniref:ATP synthase complex subunit 8 n=1 Tax=Stygiocaris lancifera TaxID=481991 RepID=A0A1Z2R725_STYLA|nr:ATP synthase F0 subunit 8 [Stygiocaris lancifera]ASA39505.1 ATP synthase F0 subunit 8 [Stygiocaris lancifera]